MHASALLFASLATLASAALVPRVGTATEAIPIPEKCTEVCTVLTEYKAECLATITSFGPHCARFCSTRDEFQKCFDCIDIGYTIGFPLEGNRLCAETSTASVAPGTSTGAPPSSTEAPETSTTESAPAAPSDTSDTENPAPSAPASVTPSPSAPADPSTPVNPDTANTASSSPSAAPSAGVTGTTVPPAGNVAASKTSASSTSSASRSSTQSATPSPSEKNGAAGMGVSVSLLVGAVVVGLL